MAPALRKAFFACCNSCSDKAKTRLKLGSKELALINDKNQLSYINKMNHHTRHTRNEECALGPSASSTCFSPALVLRSRLMRRTMVWQAYDKMVNINIYLHICILRRNNDMIRELFIEAGPCRNTYILHTPAYLSLDTYAYTVHIRIYVHIYIIMHTYMYIYTEVIYIYI